MSESISLRQNKRGRESFDDSVSIDNKYECTAGQVPKFSRHLQNSSDVKFGSGRETDVHRVEARLKQISYGKNTVGYDNYLAAVPKEKRGGYRVHPRTPDPYEEMSKRSFDGRIKMWRRELHKWDVMDSIVSESSQNSFNEVTNKDSLVPVLTAKDKAIHEGALLKAKARKDARKDAIEKQKGVNIELIEEGEVEAEENFEFGENEELIDGVNYDREAEQSNYSDYEDEDVL